MTVQQKEFQQIDCDVFVSGGGPVGLMLAIGLAQQGKSVVLVEKFAPKLPSESLEKVQNSFDGRVLALSKGSQNFMQKIGIWPALQSYTTPIEHIHVSQKGYLGLTTLHANEVDVDALGFSVQSSHLGDVLWHLVNQQDNIEVICPAVLSDFKELDNKVVATLVDVDGQNAIAEVSAKLIVGADGTHSRVREILGLPIEEKSYGAFGILAQIETEQHPQGWAFERFTEDGPVALLPMQGHAHKAVLVCPEEQVEQIKSLSDEAYIELFAEKMGERLGRFTKVSPRIAYPLKETYVPQMSKGRAVLMGNASHTQHPVAAQGLNLGIRDIEAFLRDVVEQEDTGDEAWLKLYSKGREPDHRKVMGLTDTLIQIFQHSSPIIGHLRGMGMMAMQAMPRVKRRFSKFAMRGRQV